MTTLSRSFSSVFNGENEVCNYEQRRVFSFLLRQSFLGKVRRECCKCNLYPFIPYSPTPSRFTQYFPHPSPLHSLFPPPLPASLTISPTPPRFTPYFPHVAGCANVFTFPGKNMLKSFQESHWWICSLISAHRLPGTEHSNANCDHCFRDYLPDCLAYLAHNPKGGGVRMRTRRRPVRLPCWEEGSNPRSVKRKL